jgi:transposase, IS5 family
MKANIGVDVDSGLVHTVIATAANVNDVTHGHESLHGEDPVVFADAGYQGANKHPEAIGVGWHVAMRPGKRKQQKHTLWGVITKQAEKLKASVRAKVEDPFRVIKRQFGHTKVRYLGLKKNTAQLLTLFVLFNIWMARSRPLQRVQA